MEEITLLVTISANKDLSWKKLRENIKDGVDATRGALFEDIHFAGSPDPYLLSDPDDPPLDWK